jgi:glutamyl-tRNA reductase
VRTLCAGTPPPPLLVLNTCQRLECFGFALPEPHPSTRVCRTWADREAFERLARIAAGLESRVLGELEVLGQVREALRRFRVAAGGDQTRLQRVFEDALALARKARRESGIDRTVTSLASLAGRELLGRVPAEAPLAVVGSGSLAGSVARFLAKRGGAPVRIAGRCPINAATLAESVGGFGTGLDGLQPLFDSVAGIVTATAAPHPVVYAHHLEGAGRPLTVIDLGVPPDCSADVAEVPGVGYITLADIEARVTVNQADRRRRAQTAARIIREGTRAWAHRS